MLSECDEGFSRTGLATLSSTMSGITLMTTLINERKDEIVQHLTNLSYHECELRNTLDRIHELQERRIHIAENKIKLEAEAKAVAEAKVKQEKEEAENKKKISLSIIGTLSQTLINNILETTDGWREMASSYMNILTKNSL